MSPKQSNNACLVHQRRWRTHLNALRPDVGIPEGLRVSIGGNLVFIDELGGSFTVEYETSRLRKGEAFLIFIDGDEKVRVAPTSGFD